MAISDTLRRWSSEDKLVREAAFRRNIQVFGFAAWAMVALNLLHVLVFSFLRFDGPVRSAWAHQIVAAHGTMALVMLVTGWLARRARSLPFPMGPMRLLPEFVTASVVIWAVALTAADQAISTSISAYINATVGVSIVLLLQPRSAFAILTIGWCALTWTLGLTTNDPAVLITNRMNATSAYFLAVLVSNLLWRRYVQSELLQSKLAETNRQLQLQRDELEKQARRDSLTGLLNRREILRLAEQELARARRQGTPVSLLMLDLDDFKSINDQFGHPAGDDVLRHVAEVMTHAIRQTDQVARFGGEEFVVLLPDTPEANAWHLANKLRQKLADTPASKLGTPVTVSIGLACMAAGSPLGLDALIQHADQALYQAKNEGRNRTVAAKVPDEPSSDRPAGRSGEPHDSR
jgi:diguanylate cyclase (GGDEF)-like protein